VWGPGVQTAPAFDAMASTGDAALAHGLTDLLRWFLRPGAGVVGAGEEVGCDALMGVPGDIPLPVRVVRSRWGSDPLFAGSYSYVPPAASVKDIAALGEPLAVEGGGGGRVWLAGEATNPAQYATAHGAWASGVRVAKRILGGKK